MLNSQGTESDECCHLGRRRRMLTQRIKNKFNMNQEVFVDRGLE